jgi:hypothetical protein
VIYRLTRLFLFLLTIAAFLAPASVIATAQERQGDLPTAEAVAETVVGVYGGFPGRPDVARQVLAQVRRNGVERGRTVRTTSEGRTEETTYERRFMRGANSAADKIRLDHRSSQLEYSLIYNGGQLRGVTGGAIYTPRDEVTADFMTRSRHDIDALLRYRENNSTIALAGRDRQRNIEMYLLDLTDRENRRTRYYISARTFRVLWLEYEAAPQTGGTPVRYKRTFHEYNYAQSTLVPFRSILYADNQRLEESRILTVTFGVRMDESVFNNGESSATTTNTSSVTP